MRFSPISSTSRSLICLTLLGISHLAFTQQGTKRIWTNQQGRTVEATLVSVTESDVVLLLPNGSQSTIAKNTLSQADQAFLNFQPKESGSSSTLTWPSTAFTIDPKTIPVTEGKQDPVARQYHYQSGNFEFIAYAPLAGSVLSEVASDFELVRTAFSKMPWGWEPKPRDGNLYRIYLTETDADFIAMGGDERTASGTKNGKEFIRFSSLGLKKVGQRYQYDARQKEPGRVASITTRVLFNDYRALLTPWTSYGLENYMRHFVYQTNGSLKFTDLESAFKKEVKDQISSTGSTPNLSRMLAYMRETYRTNVNNNAMKAMYDRKLDVQFLYYFFAQLDGDGKGSGLNQYYRDLFAAMANRSRTDSAVTVSAKLMDTLLAGRTDDQIAEEMIEKFGKLGFKLTK